MQRIGFNRWTSVASNQVHLDLWLSRSLGQTSMSKRLFTSFSGHLGLNHLLQATSKEPLRRQVWPFSPPIVLDAIARRPEIPPDAQNDPTKPPPTPMTSKSIRHTQKT
jgi:hypothetical protein